jgi:hypothetical protein
VAYTNIVGVLLYLQQVRNYWEDDLQSVFHVDNGQSHDNGASAESFHGQWKNDTSLLIFFPV